MQVTVLGAGTMGQGIANVSATSGHDVVLRDIEQDILEQARGAIESTLQESVRREKLTDEDAEAALARIETTVSLSEAVSGTDLVIEAAPEELSLKREIFSDAETHAPSDAVFASNTSSLSITAIFASLEKPERSLGMHFFNPAHIMGLIELINAEQTTTKTMEIAADFVRGLGKTSVEVADSPGFATSRLGVALGAEAIRMIETGVADPKDIDTAMELGYNHPMGPIELTDVVGLDVRLDVLEYLHNELGERFRPPQLLKQKVRAGKLGKKTGEGFYIWEDNEIVGVNGKEGEEKQ